jgi:squalene cyclase
MPGVKYMHLGKLLKTVSIIMTVFTCNLFFTIGKKAGSNDEIRNSQHKAINFLKNIQRSDGAICDTVNHLFETWETILAVSAIYKSNPDTNVPAVKQGLAFLRNNENSEGLICHNQKCKKAYCLETTAVYFDLLKLTGQNENIKKGLKKISALQKQTGEWDIGNPDVTIQKDFPSVTAFVLNLLQGTGIGPVYKKEAISWLLKKQTVAGDWGSSWEYYGCPAYALWPVMKILQNENTNESRMAKDKAIAFILAAQNNDGSWFYKNPDLQKQTSAALQTALMLLALQNAGLKNDEVILKGIQFLVNKQQKNGNWDGGYYPIPEKRYSKQEYVFATALAADVMQNYLLNNKSK